MKHTIRFDNGEKIEISDKSYKALEKQFRKKSERWVPKVGEKYWFLEELSFASAKKWVGNDIDLFCLGQGNVFKTEKEVYQHTKKLQAISEVVNYCWDHWLAKEWVYGEENYSVYFCEDIDKFDCNLTVEDKTSETIPFLKSKEACKQLIKEKEKELKLIFNV